MWLRAFFAATLIIARKDIRAELRSRRLISAMALFAFMAALIFYFTLESRRDVITAAIPSALWVIIVFAGTLGLSRSLSAEKDSGSLDALLLAPIPRAALFFGKFISTLLYSLLIAVIVAAVSSILFNIWLFRLELWLIVLLGTVGFSAAGTLLGCMAIYSDGRETTLPILLLPVVLPILISAVRASIDILNGLPPQDWLVWLPSLITVDVVFLALALVLFAFVVEE